MLGDETISGSVFYPDDFAAGSHYLLELDEDQVKMLEQKEEGLVIRGVRTDDAVLVTPTRSFSIKGVQTSNSLMILAPTTSNVCRDTSKWSHDEDFGFAVIETATGYLEVIPTHASLHRLRLMLEEFPYAGPEQEAIKIKDPFCPRTYTSKELQDLIQASDAEISNALADMNALLVRNPDGSECWRILDPDYMQSILTSIIYTAQAEMFRLDSIPLSVASNVAKDDDVPEHVVRHVLRVFSQEVGPEKYSLLSEKVATFYGKTILSSVGEQGLYAFKVKWRSQVPHDFEIDLEMLRGYFLLEEVQKDTFDPTEQERFTVIQWWPRDGLSMDGKTRFQQLFHRRERWIEDDLRPYLEDLAPTQKSMDALLLKFARRSTMDGDVLYTKRFN